MSQEEALEIGKQIRDALVAGADVIASHETLATVNDYNDLLNALNAVIPQYITDSDTGTELSGNAYARQQILFSAPTVVSGKTQIQNSTTITFPTATGSWGDVAYWGVRTASSGGQLLAYGSFTQTKAIALGDQLHIAINAITIILD